MRLPESWTLDDLRRADLPGAVLWVTPSVRDRVERELGLVAVQPLLALSPDTRDVIVVGGGTLLDEAKVHLHRDAPEVRLIAVPSIWGSGAEASPIAVLNRDGKKEIVIDEALVPAIRVMWPELAESIPPALARDACGDCWAHALEGFLSPLATDELRTEIAALIQDLLALPVGNDPRWFELGMRACVAQSRSGVGLVHGMAHPLEGVLPLRHATLCSTLLWPVMRFNQTSSDKFVDLCGKYDLDTDRIMATVAGLFDDDRYEKLLPALEEHWRSILRDPCTRMNSVLVRPKHLEFFVSRSFRS